MSTLWIITGLIFLAGVFFGIGRATRPTCKHRWRRYGFSETDGAYECSRCGEELWLTNLPRCRPQDEIPF